MTYGQPTTYTKIVPERGCGFILKRIYDLTENPNMPHGTYCKNPTKQDIYCGTSWANRPGFASVLWGSLIKNGLIESNGGMQEYKYYSFYKHPHVGTRATGHYEAGNGYTVRYHLTPKGRGVLYDMMARVNKIREEKKAFCERNGIEFGTGRVLNTVGSVAEYDAEKDLKELEKLAGSPPPEILRKEATDCAKLAASYAAENQKLRTDHAEQIDELTKRIVRLAEAMQWIEDSIADAKTQLDNLIEFANAKIGK